MKLILFVCTENSARSQMAEALFNFHNKNPQYKAISAGTSPAKAIKQGAVEAMKEKGIDISRKQPKALTQDMARTASRIYTMGCSEGCPMTPPEKTEDWALEDPGGKSIAKFREVLDDIEKRVKKLILELQ